MKFGDCPNGMQESGDDAHGDIPAGAVVLARTGWSQRWTSRAQYRNEDKRGVMHFPGFSEDAAKFLVEGRAAMALGIDTLSVDAGSSKTLAVHDDADTFSGLRCI